MKRGRGVAIIVLVLACLIGFGYLSTTVMQTTNKNQGSTDADTTGGIKLGLDLSGGVSITYEIQDEKFTDTDVSDTIAKLEKRAESYTTEYSVYKVGDDRITVEIPGVFDYDKVLEELGNPGTLYFIEHYDADGNANYTLDQTTGEYKLNYEIDELIDNGSVILSGDAVKNAEAKYYGGKSGSVDSSQPVVSLQFSDEAATVWGDATQKAYDNNKDTIAVYYDGSFISVPSVSSPIKDGNCIIEGQKSFEEAEKLATYIRVGSMNLKLQEIESTVVNAQLGGEALPSSVKAAVIGLALVMVFMIIMYGLSGVVASVALGIYSTLVVLFVYWFEITLTLPGIAGVILGIGMAVDANVIIFARIREEIAAGKSVSAAISEGYKKATSAILDGNITTFIAAAVLMWLGSGTVRGFSYTLMISILLSMFTALIVARFLMLSLYSVGFKAEKFYGRAKERKVINFMKNRKVYFGISLAVIVAGFVGMAVYASSNKGPLNYGLEFVGGTSTTVDMGKEYTVDQLESDVVPVVADALGITAAQIQVTASSSDTTVTVKTPTLTQDERATLEKALVDGFSIDESTIESQSISSTISSEMRRDAIIAVVVACICMLLYIWVRFKDIRFATSAIAALVHDVLIVLTAYALIRISVGNTFIACMLTIVGYSVNDTIVIFDRIRENLHGVKKQTAESLAEVANKSLTQTLSRSINTSITTIIMVLLLLIFGVSSIREFALPLLVGLICGSYSSIFIATELWYIMKLHLGKNKIVK